MIVILAILLVHVLLLGLLWFGLRHRRAMIGIASTYGLAMLGLIAFQTGHLGGASAAAVLPAPSSRPPISNRQCGEILTVLRENRIILEGSSGERLVVSRAAWEQIPATAQDQIISCAEQTRPEGRGGPPIDVVQR